jgi:hypothetical protein
VPLRLMGEGTWPQLAFALVMAATAELVASAVHRRRLLV